MKRYAMILAAALTLAACNDIKPENSPVDDGSMRFAMQHPADIVRATAAGFENGDRIGVYVTDYNGSEVAPPLQISGNWANNVAVTFDGSTWTGDKKIFWSDSKMDIYAYYPYMEPTSIDLHPFSVALDQSAEGDGDALGGYEASDFLWAKAEGLTSDHGTVALSFRHRMSKLVVQLVKGADYDGDFPEASTLYIHSVVPTATIDFTTGAVVKDIFGEMATITARKVDNGLHDTFEAILVPQRLDSRRPFIELVSNGVSYLVEDTFYFKAGKQHTITLTINSNPDQVSVDIGGEIVSDWTE